MTSAVSGRRGGVEPRSLKVTMQMEGKDSIYMQFYTTGVLFVSLSDMFMR